MVTLLGVRLELNIDLKKGKGSFRGPYLTRGRGYRGVES